MSDLNPMPWPENREPTTTEWVAWFETHDQMGRERIASLVLTFTRESARCIEFHGGVRGFAL